MWGAVRDLGFEGGRVLEPGCGSGNFIGLAPSDLALEMVGVELDPTTAAIAAALYPRASIRAEGFEQTRLPDGSFDLVVGNVPFARVVLHDLSHNRGRHSLHNHFIIKSLHLSHPGALVAVITSRFTMDARNPAARREISELADLVGAVRLPGGAMQAAAGTGAVTDLLVLRRRGVGEPPAGVAWERTVPLELADGQLSVNQYFAEHPAQILGELRATGGQYSELDLQVVAGPEPLETSLAAALAAVVGEGKRRALTWSQAPDTEVDGGDLEILPVGSAHKEGSFLVLPSGALARVVQGAARPYEAKPARDAGELRGLIRLRDAMGQVLDLEAAGADDVACATARDALNRRYDDYHSRYGALNRFKQVRTGRLDPVSGEALLRRAFPGMGGFRHDPDYRSVLALEMFDPETQRAGKAPVFSTRVINRREPRRGADTAQDALAISLDELGRVDLGVIASLLGTEVDSARSELGALVWEDPASSQVVTAQAYLSGDVRGKLAEAEAAAAGDPRWQPNVEALRAVVPVDIGPSDIDARLGATWIPAGDVEAFAADVLACPSLRAEYSAAAATWAVKLDNLSERHSITATSQWGTARADAVRLLSLSLEQAPVAIYDEEEIDGRDVRVLNTAETLAAREKQEALEQRFAAWVWEDPARASRLAADYNRRFNSVVVPRYDGAHLSMPGLAATFSPHGHQRDAVWRILSEPTVLLAHDVGAGKTATMAIAAVELKRLGLVKKPAIVVPNHMLEQVSREFLQTYPMARVLVADRDEMSAGGRKEFAARCATGEWDAVVITHSAFGRLPVSQELRRDFLSSRVGQLRSEIESAKAGNAPTVKRLEAAVARMEERYKRLMAEEGKDDGVCFEHTGIDYLLVDEAHSFKNKEFATHVQGVGGEGSNRATDLDLKLAYLRRHHGERVATFATATPIANSISEMWVMQSYLQPGMLALAGVESFDAWAATFGRTVTGLELAPDGGSYRIHSRFARFANVPELLTMFRATADVRGAKDLGLAIPRLRGGGPQTVVVPASEELRDYVEQLVERAEAVRNRQVRPDEDNMLKVAGDGRKAALDLRLVDRQPDPAGGKVAACADRLAALYEETKQRVYAGPTGEPSSRPGALQVVFCDLGTPHAGAWSVYEELRGQLVRRGIPEALVRFVHEAGDDRAKAELFAACRDGRVAVLIGSTEKMGVGTNVQRRLVALHHLDCPWRPADIAQREGRALRQGNQNEEVGIYRYATEASFDVYMWQTVERKAAFIHQVMAGEVAGRELEDIGDVALSYAEVKALATGNPLILEKAGVDNEVARLLRLRQAHGKDQSLLRRSIEAARRDIPRFEAQIAQLDAALLRRRDTAGERFVMRVGGTDYRRRADAGGHLIHVMQREAKLPTTEWPEEPRWVASLGGLDVEIRPAFALSGSAQVVVSIADTPLDRMYALAAELPQLDPMGLVTRLENKLRSLEETRAALEIRLARSRKDLADAEGRLGRPFDQQERLDTLRRKQAEIEAALIPAESDAAQERAATPGPAAESHPALGFPPSVHYSVPGGALGAGPPGPGTAFGR
ncbi:MAG TPA: SNF2-related protein [Actinomycetota bacterium]|nr:SNF2-related protein [Actinomycetota bacterium]